MIASINLLPRILTSTLLTMLLFSGGCSSLRPPQAAITRITLTTAGEEALGLRCQLEVSNPNRESVELRHVLYSVSIDGTPVYKGKRAMRLILIPEDTRTLELPVVVRYDHMQWGSAGVVPAEVRYELSGELHYIMPGEIAEILLDTGVRKPHVNFSRRGKVSLRAETKSPNPHNP